MRQDLEVILLLTRKSTSKLPIKLLSQVDPFPAEKINLKFLRFHLVAWSAEMLKDIFGKNVNMLQFQLPCVFT